MYVLLKWFARLFGSRNQRLLRGYGRIVAAASQLEPGLQALDDTALRAKTDEFTSALPPAPPWMR